MADSAVPETEAPEISISHSLPLYPRPKTRRDCAEVVRPCLFVQCRYNLVMDVPPENFEKSSCALDVADEGENSLSDLAELLGLSRERVRQIEQRGLRKLGETKFGKQMRRLSGRRAPAKAETANDVERDDEFDPLEDTVDGE